MLHSAQQVKLVYHQPGKHLHLISAWLYLSPSQAEQQVKVTKRLLARHRADLEKAQVGGGPDFVSKGPALEESGFGKQRDATWARCGRNTIFNAGVPELSTSWIHKPGGLSGCVLVVQCAGSPCLEAEGNHYATVAQVAEWTSSLFCY